MTMHEPSSFRKGVATVWAMVILAMISAVSAATISQFAAARRQTDMYRNDIQAEWLARSGYEMAVAKLLADPKGYLGEKIIPVTGGEITITVKGPGENAAYRIESVAHYPVGERSAVVRSMHRTVKRIDGPNGVQIEPVESVP